MHTAARPQESAGHIRPGVHVRAGGRRGSRIPRLHSAGMLGSRRQAADRLPWGGRARQHSVLPCHLPPQRRLVTHDALRVVASG